MPDVESWDDDDFAIGGDDLTLGSTNNSTAGPSRRESHSSHLSFRSDLESLQGEEKQVHLPGDDEKSTLDAVTVARNAGIPIPQNVPPSALTGGTIKRLGGRKIQKAMVAEDWTDDIVLPEQDQALCIKTQDASKFPAVLRQVSSGSATGSPVKQQASPLKLVEAKPPSMLGGAINLDQFKDNDDDDDLFGDGMETIKVSKNWQTKPISLITPPTPQKNSDRVDEFENDLELPSNGKLELSKKRDIPKTPSTNTSDDFDWGEGSLGTRFGGTRRSARSSSASALSPSVSSSITAESEDETFDGLLLPTGRVDFSQRLQRRRISRSPDRIPEEPEQPKSSPKKPPQKTGKGDQEDLLDGLDLGEGEVFDSKKLTLNRNIKLKNARPSSPARPKTAVSLTFTNKLAAGTSRLPRPNHERARSSLEPVSESGESMQTARNRRSLSRVGGHSAHSSISSINTPTTPSSTSSSIPSTPNRRQLGQKTSQSSLRSNDHAPHTTSAQLLRLKRSCPVMKALQSPAKPMVSRYERPPSRTDTSSRQSYMRPKTPVERRPKTPTERKTVESAAAQARKNPLPFLPAGASSSQSHHVTAKSSRTFRRHDSDNSLDFRPYSRTVSRSTMRSPSPRRGRIVPDGSWRHQTRPARQRNFGDGHELDGFDDLPTSKETEARYMRQPVASGPKLSLRNKHYQNILPDRTATPSPLTPYTPARVDNTPHFARDTAASRIARETSLAQRGGPGGPVAPLTSQRVAQLASRPNFNPLLPQNTIRSKKSRRPISTKPLLISNLNSSKQSKVVNGMYYNADTFRWEGNENALNAFEPPTSSPSTASFRQLREKENTTPRLGLITNINATKGVQVVGQMVFDPQNMCWLKMGTPTGGKSEPDPMDGFNALDDEDDVFKDIPDLEDKETEDTNERSGRGRLSDIKDEWLVGEEFDVGPEFMRRQREEEERWRKKCDKWATPVARDRESWRWSIRDIVNLS
ncbi:hypothetical protein MKZ38_000677 [Zalerion maritima]|uniref:Cytokinesis inhibitor byr4 n=1 Tax=Zalerion maritima TaxID=339359 RepID=A0AAD5RSK6_9PEZI|nr:hypothetical protein MKZ38_000677 [Zalerion maritima]